MSLTNESKKTVQLAIPIILGELAQMALHLIDTMMIGSIGGDSYKQVAAAALAFSFTNIPFVLGIGMTMSISQLVSMAKGKGDDGLVSHYLYNGFFITLLAALGIVGFVEFGNGLLYHFKQSPEIVAMSIPFLKIIGWSIFPMLLFMALKQFADGLEITRTAMILSFIALPINIGINYCLVFGNFGFPRMEMMGAAWGTLITRTILFFILLFVVLNSKHFKTYISLKKTQWYFKKSSIKELLTIGVPSSLQVGMEAGVFAVSGIIVGTMGAQQLAAHQIALQAASTTFMVSMGLAHAGSIRVSNAYGRKDFDSIYNIGKSTLFMALGYGILCAILFTTFKSYIPNFFLTEGVGGNEEVIALVQVLLIFAAFFQISDATQATSSGLLRGVKDVNVPTRLIGIAYWIICLPVGVFLANVLEWKAKGIWVGFILGLTFSSISLTNRFFKLLKTKRAASQPI